MFIWPVAARSDILRWPAQYVALLLAAVFVRCAIARHFNWQRPSEGNLNVPIAHAGRGALLWAAVVAVSVSLFKLSNISCVFVLCFVTLAAALSLLCDKLQQVLCARRQGTQRIALVTGRGTQAEWLSAYLRTHFHPRPYSLVKCLSSADLRALGERSLNETIGLPDPHTARIEAFVAAADVAQDASTLIPLLVKTGARTHILSAICDASTFRLRLSEVGGVPLMTICGGELDPLEAGVKRAIAFAAALVGPILASPLMAIISAIVKMSSRGPGSILSRTSR